MPRPPAHEPAPAERDEIERRFDMHHQPPGATDREEPDAGIAACIRAWAAAVVCLSCRPVSLAKIERSLAEPTGQLVTMLHGESFTIEAAHEIGAALVDADLTDPQVLQRTIEVLGQFLPGCARREDAEVGLRLIRLLGAISRGFTQALHRRAVAGQALTRRDPLPLPASAARVERFRTAFTNAAIGIAITDVHGRVVEANQSLADLLGYEVDELPGVDLPGLAHRDDAPEVREYFGQLLADGTADEVRFERRLVRRDGAVLWVLLALSVIRDDAGRPASVVFTALDVTGHHHIQRQLRHQAFHDPLTGLPNRALLAERIHQLFATADTEARAGLCFVDLDGFKAVNDSLGHDVGDRLLAAAAARIGECVRDDADLVARVGGDEFVILVGDDAGPGVAADIAERVLQAVRSPFRIGGHELRISASIGVAERPVATTTPADLLRAADLTMQRAKAGGKGRWEAFDPPAGEQVPVGSGATDGRWQWSPA